MATFTVVMDIWGKIHIYGWNVANYENKLFLQFVEKKWNDNVWKSHECRAEEKGKNKQFLF